MNVAGQDHDVRNLVLAEEAHEAVARLVPLPLIIVAVGVRAELPQAHEDLVSDHPPLGAAVLELLEQPCFLLGAQDLIRQIGVVRREPERTELLFPAFDAGVNHDDVSQVSVF